MINYENWCSNLKDYWQRKDITSLINLFSDFVEYYEEPNNRLTSFKEVKQVWEEIKNQNTTNISYKILCINENTCIVNFILKDEVSYDMIYEIKLNTENKCIYFKQWYMEY